MHMQVIIIFPVKIIFNTLFSEEISGSGREHDTANTAASPSYYFCAVLVYRNAYMIVHVCVGVDTVAQLTISVVDMKCVGLIHTTHRYT